jgi:hypothetical protein
MQNETVKFSFDLLCDWKKTPPTYRVYVNNELFTERTYIWGVNQYICENLSIVAPPGKYSVRIDNIGDPDCTFKVRNLTVNNGAARVVDSKTIEVYNENQ